MIKNRLILMPSSIPWEWTADYMRQTALQLERENLVWIFEWFCPPSLKELYQQRKGLTVVRHLEKNIYLYAPVQWIPFKRFKRVVEWNFRLNYQLFLWMAGFSARKRKIRERITWIFDPYFNSLKWSFGKQIVVYDAVDFFLGAQTGKAKQALLAAVTELSQRADVLSANSHVLLIQHARYRNDVLLVPQGFDSRALAHRVDAKVTFAKHPVIGYVGGINYRLDYALIQALIRRHPEWQFVLWGPIQRVEGDDVDEQVAALRVYDNVIMGQSPREELAGIIAQFDAAIIPYRIHKAFERYCFPMKLFEYLYVGSKIVASDILELRYYPEWVTIAHSEDEWVVALEKAVKRKLTIGEKAAQRKLAAAHSWERKVEMITSRVASIQKGG